MLSLINLNIMSLKYANTTADCLDWDDMLNLVRKLTYSGAYPFTFRQPIKHKIAFKSTILYPFIP